MNVDRHANAPKSCHVMSSIVMSTYIHVRSKLLFYNDRFFSKGEATEINSFFALGVTKITTEYKPNGNTHYFHALTYNSYLKTYTTLSRSSRSLPAAAA